MLIGGYQIVDFKETPLEKDTAKVIKGVYETIEGNLRRRLVLSGLVVGDKEYNDVEFTFTVDSGNFVANVYGLTITITADDEVTVSDAPEAEIPAPTATVRGGVLKGDNIGYLDPAPEIAISPELTAYLAEVQGSINAIIEALETIGAITPNE